MLYHQAIPASKLVSIQNNLIIIFNQLLFIILMNLLLKTKYFINVYSGISPSLLASISMGAQIKATSQNQLIQQLKKKSIVQTDNLQKITKYIDRRWFTKDKTPYYNKPTKISKNQYMTDPFTQILILQKLQNIISELQDRTRQYNCIDIGTGHGYMAFNLWMIMNNKGLKFKISAIDLFKQAILMAEQINKSYLRQITNINFRNQDIDNSNNEVYSQKYDFVNCGFFVNNELHQKLINSMSNQAVGIWPIQENNEQRLFLFKKQNNTIKKQYIITTLFSQQKKVLNPTLQKYFVQYDNESNQDQSPQHNFNKSQQNQKDCNKIKQKQQEQRLKQKVKQWQLNFKKENGRVPNLIEMKKVPEIVQILQKLKKFK